MRDEQLVARVATRIRDYRCEEGVFVTRTAQDVIAAVRAHDAHAAPDAATVEQVEWVKNTLRKAHDDFWEGTGPARLDALFEVQARAVLAALPREPSLEEVLPTGAQVLATNRRDGMGLPGQAPHARAHWHRPDHRRCRAHRHRGGTGGRGPMTPKERRAALRALRSACEAIEQAANALKPHEDALYVADMRRTWLDDARALARLYGQIARERDPP